MIVPRFTLFTENFLIRCNQVTEMFRSGHDCTRTSSARSSRYFGLQADITIWAHQKVRMYIVLSRTGFHFCSRFHWKLMRWLGSVSTCLHWVRQSSVKVLSSTKNCLNSCSQRGAIYLSLYLWFTIFSVNADSCSGSHRCSSLVLPLLSCIGLSICWHQVQNLVMKDKEVGESAAEEEPRR